MKKTLIILLKSLGVIAIAIVLFLAIVFIVNMISNKSEQGKIESFGQSVQVDGSTENIVSENHEALQQLIIDRYTLMSHSIAGIYGLDYVNKYPNEVSALYS